MVTKTKAPKTEVMRVPTVLSPYFREMIRDFDTAVEAAKEGIAHRVVQKSKLKRILSKSQKVA